MNDDDNSCNDECCVCMNTINEQLSQQYKRIYDDKYTKELKNDLVNNLTNRFIKLNCCGKKIHNYCLNNWFLHSLNLTCPLCRHNFTNLNVIELLHDEISHIKSVSEHFTSLDNCYYQVNHSISERLGQLLFKKQKIIYQINNGGRDDSDDDGGDDNQEDLYDILIYYLTELINIRNQSVDRDGRDNRNGADRYSFSKILIISLIYTIFIVYIIVMAKSTYYITKKTIEIIEIIKTDFKNISIKTIINIVYNVIIFKYSYIAYNYILSKLRSEER